IGSGPGGYVSAIRAAQLGLKVAIVEKGHMGGTCLNVGCIPTKAMLASVDAMATARKGKEYGFTTGDVQPDYGAMVKRRDKVVDQLRGGVGQLMKKNGIDVVKGLAKFRSAHELEVTGGDGTRRVTAANVVIATGSVPARPPIPGADLEGVVNSDQLLQLPSVPKSMAVIGAGAVGLEWGDIFNELGTKITVLELVDRILPPADADVSADLARSLQKKGFDLLTGVAVKGIERKNGLLSVRYGKEGAAEKTVDVEVVLVATGRWPFTDGLGLDSIGIQLERRAIKVDETMQTRARGVYAIGDATPGPALAHVASKGGEIAAEVVAGHKARMDYRVIPSCVYTTPEVAWVGLGEAEAVERHGEVRVGKFPFRIMGRAMASGYKEGFVKIIAEPKYGEILGVHMIGPHVTDLIAEPVLGMSMEATVDEIFHAIHAHPTLPETFQEATMDAWHRAIHKA
ncbi:MAG TPA: dihydrolipoyl dehydrogenase, partial [Armatimonadota bacterium]|nr:dihydrolipoyl dehydrogenase [Armatimonadota bacterium]